MAAEHQAPIRFGLTLGFLTVDQGHIRDWSRYLEEKLGRRVEFSLVDSCRGITDLLQTGQMDFAWIGGYCFVKSMALGHVKLMSVPVYRGEPYHRSLVIVHRDSPITQARELRGRVFAFSGPDSNTGYAYPMSVVPGDDRSPGVYFRQAFFTSGHIKTVQAVVEQVADAGAVDSYIWDYLASTRPDITRKTRIILQSPKFAFPPMVSRAGIEPETVGLMKSAIESMNNDAVGRNVLAALKLDKFRQFPASLFNSTRKIANQVRPRGSWPAAVAEE